jgi:hypothetical protein
MIEKENERLSLLRLTRIMVGELRAIAQKLCVSIQRGGACRNKCRHARRVEVDHFGNYSRVEFVIPVGATPLCFGNKYGRYLV